MKNIFNVLIVFFSLFGLSNQSSAGSASKALEFSEKCSNGKEITISAVGDVLLHQPLQQQAFSNSLTYKSLWPSMIPLFNMFNISYANFEGPSAEGLQLNGQLGEKGFKYNKNIYSSYPAFNYHPHLVRDLVQSGIDVVSTANNHALDRRSRGADMTIEAMREHHLRFTGTRDNSNQGWHVMTDSDGIRVAWLACTFSTNGIVDRNAQVLMCYQDRQEILNYVKALSRDPSINAVIVTPHWGNEYMQAPAQQEMQFGRQLIDAGALAVLGTHPHVIQPWEKYQSPVSQKEGLIVYSSGNFVSGQFHRIPTQVGLMIGLQLIQDNQTLQLKIKAAKYLPLIMKRQPYRVEPIFDDSKESSQLVKIWSDMYPAQNRITNTRQMFVNSCN